MVITTKLTNLKLPNKKPRNDAARKVRRNARIRACRAAKRLQLEQNRRQQQILLANGLLHAGFVPSTRDVVISQKDDDACKIPAHVNTEFTIVIQRNISLFLSLDDDRDRLVLATGVAQDVLRKGHFLKAAIHHVVTSRWKCATLKEAVAFVLQTFHEIATAIKNRRIINTVAAAATATATTTTDTTTTARIAKRTIASPPVTFNNNNNSLIINNNNGVVRHPRATTIFTPAMLATALERYQERLDQEKLLQQVLWRSRVVSADNNSTTTTQPPNKAPLKSILRHRHEENEPPSSISHLCHDHHASIIQPLVGKQQQPRPPPVRAVNNNDPLSMLSRVAVAVGQAERALLL